jgi:hypothetical protein
MFTAGTEPRIGDKISALQPIHHSNNSVNNAENDI